MAEAQNTLKNTAQGVAAQSASPSTMIELSSAFQNMVSESYSLLKKANLTAFADEVAEITREAKRQKFTVAVVGEFSRGKSTFINNLFGRHILPVANMPTTAMLTRIRYSENEAITVIDVDKKQKKVLPLRPESWDEYIADDDGNDPNGVAFVGLKSNWLRGGIEIIDTPGAGDLEASRARVIGDALKSSDSAIITISAESAMSLSEKLFIEERLISKKTPFLMLIITKLDRIEVSQRNSIIDFVRQKLDMWGIGHIPVYVPANMQMPDNKYVGIMGIDKITGQINAWLSCSDRKKLTEQWLALKLKDRLDAACAFANEQKALARADNAEKKAQLIEQKTAMLEKAEDVWEDTKLKMTQKAAECYDLFMEKASSYNETIVERLQHEAGHAQNPKKWWDEDYPYRLKIEMTNMSTALENVTSRQISKDVAWFNAILEKCFKTSVNTSFDEITDKDVYTNFNVNKNVSNVSDMTSARNISRIGITALSLAGMAVLTATGFGMPIVASMGVGTGGSIISEGFFRKKTDDQRVSLKAEIAKCVPAVIKNAMQHSENRIKSVYSDILSEATESWNKWYETQNSIVENAKSGETVGDSSALDVFLSKAELLSSKIDKIIVF